MTVLRMVAAIVAALGGLAGPGAPAGSAGLGVPAGSAGLGAPAGLGARNLAGGTAVCTITDNRAVGLSGLVVTASGYIAISDSNYDKSKIRIWYLDRHCHVTRSIGYPTPAYDPEDAALGRDGTLYVADIGDNGSQRKTVAIWRIAPGSRTPKIYRYAYPDGPHDAEALLLGADDEPIIVTKEPLSADFYTPTGKPDPSGKPVPLRKAATVRIDASDPNDLGLALLTVVTGAAQTSDRTKVALRTYAGAYEWAVTGGDVIKAITTTKPVITPLPGEPQGEAIAYEPGGAFFDTLSDVEDTPMRNVLRRYPSGIRLPSVPSTSPPGGRTGAAATTHKPAPVSIALLVLAIAVAALAIAGLVALLARRRRASTSHTTDHATNGHASAGHATTHHAGTGRDG